jgi:hypothetical protein
VDKIGKDPDVIPLGGTPVKALIPYSTRSNTRNRKASILIASVIIVVVAGIMALSWLGFVTHSMQASVRDRERLASLYAAEAGIEMVIDWFNNPDYHADTIRDWDAPEPRNFGVLSGLSPRGARAAANSVITTNSTRVYCYEDGALSKEPLSLTSDAAAVHPEQYELRPFPQLREGYKYGVFEPFVRDYVKNFEGFPMDPKNGMRMWDDDKEEWINGYGPQDLVPLRFTFFYPGPRPMDSINREDPKDVSIRSKIPSMVIDLTSFGDDLPGEIEHVGFRFGRDIRNAVEDGATFARLESLVLLHPADLMPPDGSLPTAFGPFSDAEMQRMGADLAAVLDDRRIAGPITTKVVATGISRSGIRTTVEAYLVENIIPDVGANAALMSQNGVTFTSNTNIRWGEILTYGDHILQSSWDSHYPFYPEDGIPKKSGSDYYDPWFAHRITSAPGPSNERVPVFFKDSAGRFLNGNTSNKNDPFTDTAPAEGSTAYKVPLHPDYAKKLHKKYQDRQNMLQNEEFTIVPKDYQSWKEFVLEFMPESYYFTGPDGTIYGMNPAYPSADGKEPRYIGKSFNQWFDVDPADPDYWKFEELVTFIDSVPVDNAGNVKMHADGYPEIDSTHYPRDPTKEPDKVVMATIKEAGKGTHTRGIILAAAHLDMAGQGKAAAWADIKDPLDPSKTYVLAPDGTKPDQTGLPNGEINQLTISHNGLLHSWGRITNAGNRTFYGSVHADEGFWEISGDGTAQYGGKGTPSIYFNYRMADGSWLALNQSRVRRSLWDITAIARVDG